MHSRIPGVLGNLTAVKINGAKRPRVAGCEGGMAAAVRGRKTCFGCVYVILCCDYATNLLSFPPHCVCDCTFIAVWLRLQRNSLPPAGVSPSWSKRW